MKFKEMLDYLAGFHQIDDDGMPTFKARIQILRNAGVPAVTKVGKGSWATFSHDHLAELHLGLAMSEFGFTPTRISQFMEYIRITPSWWPFTNNANKWLVISLRASNGKISDLDSKDVIQGIGIIRDAELKDHLDTLSSGQVPLWIATIKLNKIVENLKSVE